MPCSTSAARAEPDEHVARRKGVELHVIHDEGAADAIENGRAKAHQGRKVVLAVPR